MVEAEQTADVELGRCVCVCVCVCVRVGGKTVALPGEKEHVTERAEARVQVSQSTAVDTKQMESED